MTRLKELTQGERLVLVAGVLLVLDLLLLPWHDAHLSGAALATAEALGFNPTPAAVQAPDPGYGVAAVILTLVMVVQIALARLASVRVPEPRIPWSQVHLIAGVFVLVVLVFKLLRDTGGLGYGAYSGVLGGLLVAYGGYAIAQESARSA